MRRTFYRFLFDGQSGSLRYYFWLRCSFGRLRYRTGSLEFEKLGKVFMLLF